MISIWKQILLTALFVALMVGIAIFTMNKAVKHYIAFKSSADWVQVPAEINRIESYLHKTWDDEHYVVDIEFSYQYNGKTYYSNRFNIDSSEDDELLIPGVKAQLEKKTPLFCFVNPVNPTEAVFIRHLIRGTGGALCSGLAIIFVTGAIFVLNIAKAMREKENENRKLRANRAYMKRYLWLESFGKSFLVLGLIALGLFMLSITSWTFFKEEQFIFFALIIITIGFFTALVVSVGLARKSGVFRSYRPLQEKPDPMDLISNKIAFLKQKYFNQQNIGNNTSIGSPLPFYNNIVKTCIAVPEGTRGFYWFLSLIFAVSLTYIIHSLWFSLQYQDVPVYKVSTVTSMIPPIFYIICPILGFFCGELYYRRRIDLLSFTLKGSTIIQGKFFQKTIPFSSITKLVIGLPYTLEEFQESAFKNVDFWAIESPYYIRMPESRATTLLFLMKDGSRLPVNFLKLKMGIEFQEVLLKATAHLVDQNYLYNIAEERFFLKSSFIMNGKWIKKIKNHRS